MDNIKTNQEPLVETPVINQELPLQPETQPIEEPGSEFQPQPELTPEPTAPSNEYQQVLNEYATNTQRLPIIDVPPKSSEEQLQDLGISTPPKTNNFFKLLFTLALIVFILIAAVLGFVYFKNKQPTNDPNSSNFSTTDIYPTDKPNLPCTLNDKTYDYGFSFDAADGCNICLCDENNTITCTEKVCDPTAVPTKSATDSSTKKLVPTASQSATQN